MVKCHCTTISLTPTDITKCWWSCQLEFLYIDCRNAKWYTIQENGFALLKINYILTLWPCSPTHEFLTQGNEILCSFGNLYSKVHSSSIYNYPTLGTSWISFIQWVDKQTEVTPTMQFYSAKHRMYCWHNLYKSQRHSAHWKKPIFFSPFSVVFFSLF